MNTDLKRGIDAFWKYVPSQIHGVPLELLCVKSRTFTSIFRQRQFQLYGHVARLPEANPCWVVSERDNPA